MKWLDATANLQQAVANQTMTPDYLFTFCKENIQSIKFLYAEKNKADYKRQFLEERSLGTDALPGTRSSFPFTAVDEFTVAAKRCSDDSLFAIQRNLYCKPCLMKFEVADFMTCLYEDQRWVGVVSQVDKERSDACVKFIHPGGPSNSFNWQELDDLTFFGQFAHLCIMHS